MRQMFPSWERNDPRYGQGARTVDFSRLWRQVAAMSHVPDPVVPKHDGQREHKACGIVFPSGLAMRSSTKDSGLGVGAGAVGEA